MRKIKRVKIDDYVLVSRWSDHDLNDPWFIGHISEYGVDNQGDYYKLKEDHRFWRNVFRISKEEADERLSLGRTIPLE